VNHLNTDSTVTTNSTFIDGGVLTPTSGYFTSDYIRVQTGDTINYTYDSTMGVNHYIWCYDASKTLVGTGILGAVVGSNVSRTATISTANVAYIRLSFGNARRATAMVTVNTPYPSAYVPYGLIRFIEPEIYSRTADPLAGKLAVFDGDSITAGTGWAGGYPKMIGDMYGLRHVNYGVGGGTITAGTTTTGGTDRHWVSRNVDNWNPDADYIIIQMSSNDYSLTVPMGDMLGTFTTTAFDDTTFAGALENTFLQAQLKYPAKKIGLIIPFKVYGTFQVLDRNRFETYIDMAKKICVKWSVPYLDLYSASPLNFGIKAIRDQFSLLSGSDGDGTHPNEAGYRALTPVIANWMMTL